MHCFSAKGNSITSIGILCGIIPFPNYLQFYISPNVILRVLHNSDYALVVRGQCWSEYGIGPLTVFKRSKLLVTHELQHVFEHA